MFPEKNKIFVKEIYLIFGYLDAVRRSPRLEVERDGVGGGEGLDGADSCGSPVHLNGVTVTSYPGGSTPDAHVHRVARVLEPEGEI